MLALLNRICRRERVLSRHDFPFLTEREKNPTPRALNFGESRFPGSNQIPFPAKIFCVFPESRTVFCSNPGSRKYPSSPCF